MKAKQVIIMRKDLKMRKGKMIAQGAHASLGGVAKFLKKRPWKGEDIRLLKIEKDSYLDVWLNGTFTKIAVGVDSEEELMEIYEKAGALDIPRCLITDAGLTEFNGVPTKTCISIGPYWSDKIDEITGNLKLL